MHRRLAVAFVAVAAIAPASVSAQSGGTVVLTPAFARDVGGPTAKRIASSVTTSVSALEGVRMSGHLAGGAMGGRQPSLCVTDATCLSEVGRAEGARRIMGIRVARAKPAGYSFLLILVQVDGAAEIMREELVLKQADLATEPGDLVGRMLALAPVDSTPTEGEKSAPTSADPAPPPRADADVELDVASQAEALDGSASESKPLHLGVRAGAMAPRGDLDSTVLVGLEASLAAFASLPKLRVRAALDWVRLTQQDSTIVGPPDFPRARTQLIQDSQVVVLCAGATYDVAQLASVDLYAGAALGLAMNRSEFRAFGMEVPQNDVNIVAEAQVGARGAAGPAMWGVGLAWRESEHDLGDEGLFGEDIMSGLLATVALAYGF